MSEQRFKWPGIGVLLCVALALVPVVTALRLIARYSYNFPYWDDWPTLIKFYAQDQPLAEYFRLYNDHRIVLPRLIMLVIGHLTALDMRVFMVLNWFIATVTVFLLWLASHLMTHSPPPPAILMPRPCPR